MQALADAIDEMAQNLEQEFGLTRHTDLAVDDAAMAIKEPLDPLFRVGAMGLGYDANRDRILLVAQEALGEEEERDPREARFFATRAQMEALSRHAREVVGHGRSPEKVALQVEAHRGEMGTGTESRQVALPETRSSPEAGSLVSNRPRPYVPRR